ncbi:MAG: DeoR/GlpR transcriptional regulator [Oscillospiraceae bacterium]|nr:DeoR/GlpR transcriptional regulator [Oscillospiraceae bacterium]
MASGKLKIDARRQKILQILSRDGQVRVAELSKLLDATPVTIRNDLDALEKDGFLERIQGGAVQSVGNAYQMDFLQRRQQNGAVKKRLAAAVTEMIRDGDTILLNSGTTTYYVAVELKKRKNLNIVTNSISAAAELGDHPTFRVILLGGDINAQYSFTHGSDAQAQLRNYRADYCILSVDGISSETGVTTYHAEEAVMDRLMIERAACTIVAAESRKLGREGFSHVCEASEIDWLVTDAALEQTAAEELQKKNIRIRITK